MPVLFLLCHILLCTKYKKKNSAFSTKRSLKEVFELKK